MSTATAPQGTETMQTLIVGRDITGVSAFVSPALTVSLTAPR
jgi:hypothetical protein